MERVFSAKVGGFSFSLRAEVFVPFPFAPF
jgi:hypothetical protein